jgi:DNA sulfur modification protein DndE
MIESIRLNRRAKTQLSTLKRRTGIKNWNILCRWAFCLSLSAPDQPRKIDQSGESEVEMTWKTFAGQHDDIYLALLKQRCIQQELKITPKALQKQLHNHLYRGIGYLVSNNGLKNISSLNAIVN